MTRMGRKASILFKISVVPYSRVVDTTYLCMFLAPWSPQRERDRSFHRLNIMARVVIASAARGLCSDSDSGLSQIGSEPNCEKGRGKIGDFIWRTRTWNKSVSVAPF